MISKRVLNYFVLLSTLTIGAIYIWDGELKLKNIVMPIPSRVWWYTVPDPLKNLLQTTTAGDGKPIPITNSQYTQPAKNYLFC